MSAEVVLQNGMRLHADIPPARDGVRLDLQRPDGSMLGRIHLTQDEADDIVEAIWGARRRLTEPLL